MSKKQRLDSDELWRLVSQAAPHARRVLIYGPPGCLAANTMIQTNRGGNGRKMPIAHIASRVGNRSWRDDITTYVGRAVDDRTRLAVLADAWASGIKETFTLKTVSGREIRATSEHPFLRADGAFIPLGDFSGGEYIQIDAGKGGGGRVGQRYRDRYTRYHPNQRTAKDGFRTPEHKLAYEARANDLTLDRYLDILRNDPEGASQLEYLPRGAVIHHENGDHVDNRPENLILMVDQADHVLSHDGLEKNVLSRIGTDRVLSVARYGDEPTFDIEVADDPHCFIANEFVVHNTGKSWLARRAGVSASDPVYPVPIYPDMPAAELRGHFIPTQEYDENRVPIGNPILRWMDGPATSAWRTGGRLVLDELDRAGDDALGFLLAVLDDHDTAKMVLGTTKEIITPHPDLTIWATMNGEPEDLFPALLDRFPVRVKVEAPHPDAIAALPQDLRHLAQSLSVDPNQGRRIGLRAFMEFGNLRDAIGIEGAGNLIFGPARWPDLKDAIALAGKSDPL